MTATLLVDGGGTWAHNVHLRKGQEAFIGRKNDNHIRIGDLSVSARHAVIKYFGGGWQIEDMKTPNGTLVNGVKISVAPLRNGDVIRIGKTEIVFKDKESEVPEDVWGRTSLSFLQSNDAIIQRDEAPIVLPGLEQSPEPRRRAPTPRPARAESEEEFSGIEYKGSAVGEAHPKSLSAADYQWIAENASRILAELAAQRGASPDEIYELLLRRVCALISAENGFLMIPNRRTKRWIIEAFVGMEDLQHADEGPSVPLTAANQAYKTGEVTSNAIGVHATGVDNSASMMQLRVHAYVAVPLKHGGSSAGVLYFDTRRQRGRFTERDAELIRSVGAYVIELHHQLNASQTGSSAAQVAPRPAPPTRQAARTEGDADWLFSRPAGVDELPPPDDVLPDSVDWGTQPGSSHQPSSDNDLAWPNLLEDEPPSRPSVQIPVKTPGRREGYSDTIDRLRGHEFALLLPVDRPIRMKSVVAMLMVLENLTAEQAERTIVERKGIIADRLTFFRASQLFQQAREHHDQCVCVAVPPNLLPRPVIEPRLAEMGETGIRYQAYEGPAMLEWRNIRLVTCGRLDRKPCIDLYDVDNQVHVRLRQGVLNLGDLLGQPNQESNAAARDVLAFVKHKAPHSVRAHTVRNVLSGKTPKAQKFQSEKDYADYNHWLLLANFAEKVSLEELYRHACAVS